MADGVRKKRWMPVVLGVSLALNLAVVAAISGAALRHKGDDKRGPRPGSGGVIYMQALPFQMQKELRQSLRSAGKQKRPDPSEMVAVLRGEPFDRDAAASILDDERKGGQLRMEATSSAWLSAITEMTAADRAAYADRLEYLTEERKKRWKARKGN